MIIQIDKRHKDIPVAGEHPGLIRLDRNPILNALSRNPDIALELIKIGKENFDAQHPFLPIGYLALHQTELIR